VAFCSSNIKKFTADFVAKLHTWRRLKYLPPHKKNLTKPSLSKREKKNPEQMWRKSRTYFHKKKFLAVPQSQTVLFSIEWGSVADPGSSAFLTPGSGVRNEFFPDPGS
jgi:hypothetical protein